jgi:hypothetical protein
LRHAAKGPPFHSGPLATYRNGPVSSNVRQHTQQPPTRLPENMIRHTFHHSMKKTKLQLATLAFPLLLLPSIAAAQLHKCISNGSVTYQNTPCPAGDPRKQPTVNELNAERKRKLDRSVEQSRISKSATTGIPTTPRNATTSARPEFTGTDLDNRDGKPTLSPTPTYKCDNRRYCSQMTSCAEATYFLTNCPGVKMDGNNDGVPCEQQWCK